MPAGRCVSRSRSVVIYGSFVLAVGGWALAGWAWWYFGVEAGIRPSFIMGCTVAATFTMTLAATIVLPSKARLYALGFKDGVAQGLMLGGDQEPSKLRSVR